MLLPRKMNIIDLSQTLWAQGTRNRGHRGHIKSQEASQQCQLGLHYCPAAHVEEAKERVRRSLPKPSLTHRPLRSTRQAQPRHLKPRSSFVLLLHDNLTRTHQSAATTSPPSGTNSCRLLKSSPSSFGRHAGVFNHHAWLWMLMADFRGSTNE